MATKFPDDIDTFPTMQDITAADASKLSQFQALMRTGNFAEARNILLQITDYDKKIITASLLNDMLGALTALEKYYADRWSPAIVCSETEPLGQDAGDYWFQIVGEV